MLCGGVSGVNAAPEWGAGGKLGLAGAGGGRKGDAERAGDTEQAGDVDLEGELAAAAVVEPAPSLAARSSTTHRSAIARSSSEARVTASSAPNEKSAMWYVCSHNDDASRDRVWEHEVSVGAARLGRGQTYILKGAVGVLRACGWWVSRENAIGQGIDVPYTI